MARIMAKSAIDSMCNGIKVLNGNTKPANDAVHDKHYLGCIVRQIKVLAHMQAKVAVREVLAS